ncbi:peptidoglycan-binding protein [Streptomyces sp. NPDC006314]|uniref:peptidoglycan-binding protein n=1 Tax=Streptomyces sp. NPDC006314 TaxID=3154475 RepID=UPI0033B9133C
MVALSGVRFGETNEDVRTVQKALIAQGHDIPGGPTGHFGEQTKAAYVRDRHHVNHSGSDFAARVQQADPHRPPAPY